MQKHPVILHSNDHLSHLILCDIHESHLHAGPQQMVALACQNYHIRSCKRLAMSIYRGCITCRKLNAITYNQVMGQLPENHTKPGHPFMNTGIVYAGPVTMRMGRIRKPAYVKAYICVFISFTVKAVHLELVTDLNSSLLCDGLWQDVVFHYNYIRSWLKLYSCEQTFSRTDCCTYKTGNKRLHHQLLCR